MYGWKTKSWNNSTEKRQTAQECHEVTARYLGGELRFNGSMPLICHCRSFEVGHAPERHKELPGGDLDWRTESERRGMRMFQERVK